MKTLVVNESPKDIFSDYLLGKENPIDRSNFSSAIELLTSSPSAYELIVVVNEKIEEAVKIKRLVPVVRVIAANGGTKDFSPFFTVIYGENDYDHFSYHDVDDFRHLIFSQLPRPEKLLQFSKAGRQRNQYRVNSEKIIDSVEGANYDLALFIDGLVFLSEHCLEWLSEWGREVSAMNFDIKFAFNRDKKVKNIIIPVANEYRGLPIFKDGDQIAFYEKHDKESAATATVIQIGDGEMMVNFTESITRRRLEKITSFRSQPQFLNLKIKHLTESLRWFKALSGHSLADSPAGFIANAQLAGNLNEAVIPYGSLVIFTKETEKILRDSSQVKALVDCLGPKFFNFIIGPAGTGKTFVTAALTQQFVEQNKIILLLSHSNLGVDNLILEVAKHLNHRQIFRFGNDTKVISPAARAFHCASRQDKNFFGFPDDSTRIAEKRFLKEILDKHQGVVLASTLDSYQSIRNLSELKVIPEIVIVDEASRGSFFEFTPALTAAKEKIIFIGDNRQLGNIAPSKELTGYLQEKIDGLPDIDRIKALELPKSIVGYFNKGFFNSLIELGYFEPNLLNCNRRSLIKISNLVSRVFYEGELVPGRFNPYDEGQIIFLDTRNVLKFEEKRKGTSYYNPIEATYLVKQFIAQAVKQIKGGGKITDLVIISPYMAQVRWLKKKLRNHLLFQPVIKDQVNPENIDSILDQLVITVDAIQGGQRKVVFVSLVRSNQQNEIGFNNDIRRLNVALSRAQERLVIIGNSGPFIGCSYPDISKAFLNIIKYVKARGVYKKLRA